MCNIIKDEALNVYLCNHIGGVMVSVLASRVVDGVFIGGVMISVLVSRVVDRVFIGGVMVSVLVSRVVDRVFINISCVI
jgi:hypothetical protein